MGHLPDFISDLAIILITAGIVTIIFKWLKQPLVLGYIVAGFIISPHFEFTPSVIDSTNVSTWAEIGVIFLLFALGLEFSFKKLIQVGGTASIATIINMGSMIAIGYLAGQLLGWSNMDSIFLGGMLSMSSTTIIIKAFNDMGLQKQKFARIVFGMLIVEDLAAILMMVLLSTVAVSQHFEGQDLILSILKLVFFILIWFVIGIYLVPTILKKFKKYLNDETLVIFSIGLCLGMVLFASAVGFSAALGAFIMGSILAETVEAKRIEHLTEPIKNLFGAIFFVSVGMMIAPDIIVEYAIPILILTAIVLVGRIIFATLGVLASGEGLKVSMQAGFSLAQIGEFSFIIATLGMQLGVIKDFLYPIIVAVSVITTFSTPYCIKFSGKAYHAIEGRIPDKWHKLKEGYSSSGYNTSINTQSDWNKLIKGILPKTAIYFTLAVAVLLICQQFINPAILFAVSNIWGYVIAAIVTTGLMAPFLNAMVITKRKSPEYIRLWNDSKFSRGGIISIMILRGLLAGGLIVATLSPLFPHATAILVIVALALVVILIFTKTFNTQSEKFEERFMSNLNEKELIENENAAINKELVDQLKNRDLHVEEFDIPQESGTVGKTLKDLNFKQVTGVNIVTIIRGEKKINIPDGNELLFPFDRIVVVGTDSQLKKFNEIIEKGTDNNDGIPARHHIEMSRFIIEEGSVLAGTTVKNAHIKEKTNCMVIGIDKLDVSLPDITPDTRFEPGDVVWIAGEKDDLKKFSEHYM